MEFSGFRNSVADLWLFAWPTLVFVGVLGFCLSRWFPRQAKQYRAWCNSLWSSKPDEKRLRATLKSAGAEKMYPVALAVVIVLAIYLLGETINFFDNVTPVIRPAPHALALHNFSRADIYRLHLLYPSEQKFSYAYYEADRDLFPKPLPAPDGFYLKIQTLAKAIAYTTLVLVILGLWIERDRVRALLAGFGVILVCALVWAICIPEYLWAYADLVETRVPEMTRLLKNRAKDAKIDMPPDSQIVLPEDFVEKERWWRTEVDFSSRIVWCWKTLCDKSEDTPR